MIFRSFNDLGSDIREKLLPILPRDIGTVYGIPRSGMIPASIIATAIGAKLGVLGAASAIGARQKNFSFTQGSKILVVDDSVNHGRAIAAIRSDLERLHEDYYTCAIYVHPRSVQLVDFYAEAIEQKRIFEWNFSGIQAAGKFCWSLEGVICTWPTSAAVCPEEINSARPLFLPQVRVLAIVAQREERWRTITEAWLAKYGVVYDKLIMAPSASPNKCDTEFWVEFKARCLVKTGCELLVVGEDTVALAIAKATERQVLSVESMKLY